MSVCIMDIAEKKNTKKRRWQEENTPLATVGEKNPITGMKIFVTFLLGYRKRLGLTTNTDKYSHYKLQIKR